MSKINIELTNMSFSEALELMKNGYKVRRAGWNSIRLGFDCHVSIEVFQDLRVFVYSSPNDSWQWHPSILDMLATDWELVGDTK